MYYSDDDIAACSKVALTKVTLMEGDLEEG